MDRRLKITVLTWAGKVRVFTYTKENSPDLQEYMKDALALLADDGKVVFEVAQEEDTPS